MKQKEKKKQKSNVTDTKTGVTTIRVDYKKEFWDEVMPGYKSSFTIDDFSGLRPISQDELMSIICNDSKRSYERMCSVCEYMYSNNYYLSGIYTVEGMPSVVVGEKEHTALISFNGRISLKGNFTYSDVYKIYNSLYITNASVVISSHKAMSSNRNVKMENVAKVYAEAMVNDRERFIPNFKKCIELHPEYSYGKNYEELANEYIDFAAPYAYNNFQCISPDDYFDVYGEWKKIQKAKVA